MKNKLKITLLSLLTTVLISGCTTKNSSYSKNPFYYQSNFKTTYFRKSSKKEKINTTYYIQDEESYKRLKKEEDIEKKDYQRTLFSDELDTIVGLRKIEYLELNRKGKKSYITRVINPSWTYSMLDKNGDHRIIPYQDTIMKKYPQDKHFKTIKPDWTTNYYFYTMMGIYHDSLIKKFKEKGIIK